MRLRCKLGWLTFLTLPLFASLCFGWDPARAEWPNKVNLKPVFAYRLPFVPETYWAFPVTDRPWLLVAAFQRPSGSDVANFHVFVVEWQKNKLLASEDVSNHFVLDSAKPACPKRDPFRERFVAVFSDTVAIKLCSRLVTLQLPALKLARVLLDVRPDGNLEDIATSADGHFLAVVAKLPATGRAAEQRSVLIYDTKSWEIRTELKIEPVAPYLHSLALSNHGTYVAVTSPIVVGGFGEGDHVYVFDTATGKRVSSFDLKPLPGEGGYHIPPYFFAGPASEWLLSSGGGEKKRLYVWDWRKAMVEKVIEDRAGIGRLLDVSADGLLVAASVRADSDVAIRRPTRDFKIFSLRTGKALYQSPEYQWSKRWATKGMGADLPQLWVQFSEDGEHIVEASGFDEVSLLSVSH